eukprot:COSAG02_NODE_2897_length_7780_cov_2.267934_8_plen_70_part_00
MVFKFIILTDSESAQVGETEFQFMRGRILNNAPVMAPVSGDWSFCIVDSTRDTMTAERATNPTSTRTWH